jgi:hypothetical protein
MKGVAPRSDPLLPVSRERKERARIVRGILRRHTGREPADQAAAVVGLERRMGRNDRQHGRQDARFEHIV